MIAVTLTMLSRLLELSNPALPGGDEAGASQGHEVDSQTILKTGSLNCSLYLTAFGNS